MNVSRALYPLLVSAALGLAAGWGQPARALGGGVVVSESGCSGNPALPVGSPGGLECTNTSVTVSGNIVNPSIGFGYVPGQPVNFSFALNNANAGGTSTWVANGGVDPYYFFDTVDYTALSGDTFVGSFIPANIGQDGTLKIYQSGLIVFDIGSIVDPDYTGLTLKDASPTVRPLVRYSLAFSKESNFANVPNSNPATIPTIASLLAGAAGSYGTATGEISSNIENKATYAAVPGPLPALGAGIAFSQSRRLRKRIKSRQPSSC